MANSRGFSNRYSLSLLRRNKEAYSRNVDAKDNLGVVLGNFCITNNIPVQEVANHFGVSRRTVYAWFLNKWKPRNKHVGDITKFIKAYKLDLDNDTNTNENTSK